MKLQNYCLSIVAALSLCSVAYSSPISISVGNSLFQNPALPDGVTNGEQYTGTNPPDWTSNGDDSARGVDNPGLNMYVRSANANLPGTANSTQFGYLNLNYLGDTSNYTYSGSPSLGNFVAGNIYTLTVAVGTRLDNSAPSYSISLLSNGTPVGVAATGVGETGTFYDLSETFTATAAQNGQAIGIILTGIDNISGFEQPHFTNVRLTEVVTPEPSSLVALCGLGVMGMFLVVRRRRKA
jgi:hypothetical protein